MATPNVRPGWQALAARGGLLEIAELLVLPVICLLPILLTLPFMNEPFERDEGVYATVAQGLLRGELPYRDLFDHKPPLVYVWYAISFLVFGESIVAPRIVAGIMWSLTTLVIFKQTALLSSRNVALAAALLFTLASGFVMLQANANTEALMILPATFCLYAATRSLKGGSAWWLLAVGVAGALSVFTKQVALLNLVVAAGVIAVHSLKTVGLAQTVGRLAIVGAAFVTVAAIVLAPFALTGALDDFFYANWTYNRLYASQVAFSDRIDAEIRGVQFLLAVAAPLVFLALLGLVRSWSIRYHAPILLLGLWLGAGYAGIVLSGRAFPHYYVSLLPVLAILAAIGLSSVTRTPNSSRLLIPLLGVAVFISAVVNGNAYIQATPEAKHEVRFRQVQPEMQNASPAVAARIAAVTAPDEAIYNFGRETQLYFYADRKPAVRFIYDRPFWLDPPTFDEAMADLRETRPVLIVDSVSARTDPGWEDQHPAALREFLASEYEFVGRVEFADFYRLKTSP